MLEAIIILLILVLLVSGFVALRLLRAPVVNSQEAVLLAQEKSRLEVEKARLEEQLRAAASATTKEAALRQETADREMAAWKESNEREMKFLKDSEERLKLQFAKLANDIFEAKGKTLTEGNQTNLNALLQPLKEQLAAFQTRINEVHKTDVEQSAALRTHIQSLQLATTVISQDTVNLTNALKGDTKMQGDWGEFTLQRIFDTCGMERGRDYEVQQSDRGEEGGHLRPDFYVYLPDNRVVIIDSKVSLTAYVRYCNATDPEDRKAALREHVQSVRKHIRELSGKDYLQLDGMRGRTLDFVLMCVPLEPAYQAAVTTDISLIEESKKTVTITGPNALLTTLKLIVQVWRREKENKNAEEIGLKAGAIYDQVSLIVDAMQEASNRLEKVSESFSLAMNRLSTGRGNLVRRVQEIRDLGAKTKRELPGDVVDGARDESDTESVR
ncbi:MAG: DNA recombination protein RmuC [Planctomycetes bacterium]|nr:DNA recombination protein RmuC [Planctomycetota bacterium]